jgi:hypothetical protein
MHVNVKSHSVTSFQKSEIHQLAKSIPLKSDSRVIISIPAGSNRDFMMPAIAQMTSTIAQEFPKMTFNIRLAVDTCELNQPTTSSKEIDSFPAVELAKELFSLPSMRISAIEQRESNSIIEAVEAMREAARSGDCTHLLVPRDLTLLVNRIEIGISHYAKELTNTTLESVCAVKIPSSDEPRSRVRRQVLEGASLIMTGIAWTTGTKGFEGFVEKKGTFARFLDGAHKLKVWADSSKK